MGVLASGNLLLESESMPRNRSFADSFSTIDDVDTKPDVVDDDPPTTMMIRNIPSSYTQNEFVREFDSVGFKGTYNFLYLPTNAKTNSRANYCFVNFIDHHWAVKCTALFENYLLKKQAIAAKCAKVSAARVQGLEANIAQARDKIGKGRQHGPLIVGNLSSPV